MIEPAYRVIRLLEGNPHCSQREIARELGYSVGKVNYIIASLVDKGIVKLHRFLNSDNKFAYRYVLTPKGLKARYRITREFLKRKTGEYEVLVREIEEAKRMLDEAKEDESQERPL